MTDSERVKSNNETICLQKYRYLVEYNELDEAITENVILIRTSQLHSRNVSLYNFQLPFRVEKSPHSDINEVLRNVFTLQKCKGAFKLNFSLGMILHNIETNRYKYFRAGNSDFYFDEFVTIRKFSDMPHMTEEEYFLYVNGGRENVVYNHEPRWLCILTSNIEIEVYNLGFQI